MIAKILNMSFVPKCYVCWLLRAVSKAGQSLKVACTEIFVNEAIPECTASKIQDDRRVRRNVDYAVN